MPCGSQYQATSSERRRRRRGKAQSVNSQLKFWSEFGSLLNFESNGGETSPSVCAAIVNADATGFRCFMIQLRETEIDALVRMGFLKQETRNDANAHYRGVLSISRSRVG